MLTLNSKKHLLVTSIALALAACGGGGGSNGPGATKGVAVDGYLEGSTIVCDKNGNGIADAGEPTTTTGENGAYRFSSFCNGQTILSGGVNKVDEDTSYPFTGVLKAPKGSSVITPLTTLIAEIAGPDASAADIEATQKVVAVLLGLPEDTDLTKLDPIAEAEKDGGNADLLKTTMAVQQTIAELTKLFSDQPADETTSKLVITKLAEQLSAPDAEPLINESGEFNTAALTSTVEALNTATGSSIAAAAAATGVATQAEKLSQAEDLETLIEQAETTQNPTNPPVVETPATTNYLFVKDNNVQINGGDVSFATGSDFVGAGAAVTGKLQTIGFDFEIKGNVSIDTTVSIGLEVSSAGKVVQVLIDKVDVIYSNGNPLSATVAQDALVKVFVKTTSEANVELRNLSSDVVDVAAGDVVTLNYTGILNRIKNNAQSAAFASQIDELINITGTVDVKLVANKLNLRFESTEGDSLPVLTANVNTANSTAKTASVTGYGVQGKLVITE